MIAFSMSLGSWAIETVSEASGLMVGTPLVVDIQDRPFGRRTDHQPGKFGAELAGRDGLGPLIGHSAITEIR